MSLSRDFKTNSQFEQQMNRALKLMLLYTYKVRKLHIKKTLLTFAQCKIFQRIRRVELNIQEYGI